MMTIDEMITVLQAAKAGKQIQYKHHSETEWYSVPEPLWDFNHNDYRVKPEPREWTVALDKSNNRPYPKDWYVESSKRGWEHVRVREVLP